MLNGDYTRTVQQVLALAASNPRQAAVNAENYAMVCCDALPARHLALYASGLGASAVFAALLQTVSCMESLGEVGYLYFFPPGTDNWWQ